MFPCHCLPDMKVICVYHLLLVNPYNLMSDYLYFKRHKRPHTGLYNNVLYFFKIRHYSFQRKHEPKATPFISEAATRGVP